MKRSLFFVLVFAFLSCQRSDSSDISIGSGSIDISKAHPGPREDYHYHCEGDYLTLDDSNLIGFLRDGFPVYGPKDMDGSYPVDLDENGGHEGETADFSEAIYHYHVSNEVYSTSGLYVIKSGAYHGSKGTFSQSS